MLMDEPKRPLFTPRTRLDLQQRMWDLWQAGMEM